MITNPIAALTLAIPACLRRRGGLFCLLLLAVCLAACGFSGPQAEAVRVVERHLRARQANDYLSWTRTLWAAQKEPQAFQPNFEKPGTLGVLSLSIQQVGYSEEETRRIVKSYTNSPLAIQKGWSSEYLASSLVAVQANYTVRYDHTQVPYPDGQVQQVFFLLRDPVTGAWLIWDTGSPES